MADIVSRVQLENASLDCISLEQVISGSNIEDVLTRLGQQYPTLAKALYIIIQTGGFEPFLTQAELLASIPTLPKKVALALDTENLCYWNGSSWSIAGSIAMNSTVMKTVIAIYNPALVYKGKANLNASAPSSPVANDTYIAVASGTTFGVLAEAGQLLIYTGSAWSIGDVQEVYNRKFEVAGGKGFIVDKNFLPLQGYISSTGVWTPSTAGYKTSYFKPVKAGSTVRCAAYAGGTVAQISFWDASFAFISGLAGNGTTTERTATVPANAKYMRITNNNNNFTSPYALIDIAGVLESQAVIKQSDLTIEASDNLFKPEYLVNDYYINNAGSIVAGAGWRLAKVPVSVGQTYTFGNFVIDTAGYGAFYDSSDLYISGSVFTYQTGILPRTITAPTNAVSVRITLKRPTNTDDQSAQAMMNVGGVLLPFEDPSDTITKIIGKKLAGSGSGPLPSDVVLNGGNAELADVSADQISVATLLLNLPEGTTRPAEVEIDEAWIDTTGGSDGIVKVRLL